jgi:hypothetical protein
VTHIYRVSNKINLVSGKVINLKKPLKEVPAELK